MAPDSLTSARKGEISHMSNDDQGQSREGEEDGAVAGRDTDLPRADMAFDPIEAALRQLHERIAAEAIPDDFMQLLDQLDDQPGSD